MDGRIKERNNLKMGEKKKEKEKVRNISITANIIS